MPRQPLRSTIAALLLLAPMAATFVAQPAHAQARAAQPAIAKMSINSDAGLSPGATLRVQVSATANARSASVSLGDSGVTVPLHQQAPGTYTGTYVVRRADHIDPMQLMTARVAYADRNVTRQFKFPAGFQALAMGNAPQTQPSQPMERRAARDDRSPDILDLTPANGDRVADRGRTHISARVVDEGSGIDVDSVRMRINGREVSDGVRVSGDEVHYRADLAPGRYTAEVSVRDRAGNSTRKAWTFDVTPGGDRYGSERLERDRDRVAAGPFPLEVTNHENNAVVDANGNLAIRGRTAPFANVRVEVQSVANIAGVLGVTQPVTDQTVQADRDGHFGILVTPRGLPIPGTRYDVRITATSGDRTAEERLTLFQRQS